MTGENELLGSDPAISGGALCVAGTRIRVSKIQSFAEVGYSPEAIQREYPSLSLEQIEAATAYKPSRPSPVVGEGAVAWATCQACGGSVEGWICQGCDREFREDDAGNLVFDAAPSTTQTGDGVRELVRQVEFHIADCQDGQAKVTRDFLCAVRSALHPKAPELDREALSAEDREWLERKLRRDLPVGHCGESTSEAIARGRAEDRVDRILAFVDGSPAMTANPNTAREEILPCPFCGGKASGPSEIGEGPAYNQYEVWCDCGGASLYHETEAKAATAWNRRAPASPAVGLEEAVGLLRAWQAHDTNGCCCSFPTESCCAPARTDAFLTRMESRDV